MRAPLSRRLILLNLPLLAAVLALAVALVWGIDRLESEAERAEDEYAELRLVQEAMYDLALARGSLSRDTFDRDAALRHARSALGRLDSFQAFQRVEDEATRTHQQGERLVEQIADQRLRELITALESSPAPAPNEAHRIGLVALVGEATAQLARLASETDTGATREAAQRAAQMIVLVAVLAGVVAAGSLLASGLTYRSVIGPLRRIRAAVRRIAQGRFDERVEEYGAREFAELGEDFNRMSGELGALHADLEERVRTASRDLVRSERLASVGFLAAGVAHEINNPLGIMSGHAELALRRADDAGPEARTEVRQALDIIRQEAFRCKAITERLLSLSRTGEAHKSRVSIPAIVDETAAMLAGLKRFEGRSLTVRSLRGADTPVRANAPEIKQVMLNLMVNALEAVPAGRGAVDVTTERVNGAVRVLVEDNGAGMTEATLSRAFEPFYSSRSAGPRGVGLGLSISHAIVRDHGGTLRAESEGPDRGSRFIMEIPVPPSEPRDAR